MLLLITTGDEEVDMKNIELVTDNIHTKVIGLHKGYAEIQKLHQKGLEN